MHNEKSLIAPLIGIAWAIGIVLVMVIAGTLALFLREILLLIGRVVWGPNYRENL